MNKNANSGEPSDGPFNILFSCAGRRVALIRAFREAMTELELTGSLIGSDITETAPAAHVVDVAEMICRTDDPTYLERLIELVARHEARLLVPLTDLDLALLARNAEAFEQMGCTVMIAPPAVVDACRDKVAFNDLVARAGLPTPRTAHLTAFQSDPFYPCFVKPIDGSASIGAAVIGDEAELAAHVRIFGDDLMCQEYLAGAEYTIDIYRRRDGEICAVVPRQRLAIRAGEVAKAITIDDTELISDAVALVEQMPGAWGVFNAQCRRPEGRPPYFFEVNLRFGGGAPLSIAAGVNLPKMLLNELTDRPVTPADGAFTDRLLMMRYDDAVFTRVDDPAALPGYKTPLSR